MALFSLYQIVDDEVTRHTFAEQKREGRKLFYSDIYTTTSDSSINNSDEEASSSDKSSNENSHSEFKHKNTFKKSYKSVALEDFDKIR